MITKLAYEALIKEVELTPKPGLVDRNNSGSHKDMNLQTFYESAQAIAPFIQKFYECRGDFEALRKVGLNCESAMFEATKGVNTHKGMIFSLAIFCGAIGSVGSEDLKLLQEEIKKICQGLIEKDLSNLKIPNTNGEKFFQKTKIAGIRAEAQAGYPTVFEKALPFYENELSFVNEEIALKRTLVFLMSFVPDTTLYARGGLKALEFVQNEAKKILHVKNLDEELEAFDKKMIEKNLSSGGCADLLGLTYFLSTLTKKR